MESRDYLICPKQKIQLSWFCVHRQATDKKCADLKKRRVKKVEFCDDDESKKEEQEIFWRWWWTEEWFATENEVEPVGTCVTDFLSYNAEQLVQFLTTNTTLFKVIQSIKKVVQCKSRQGYL